MFELKPDHDMAVKHPCHRTDKGRLRLHADPGEIQVGKNTDTHEMKKEQQVMGEGQGKQGIKEINGRVAV